MTDRQMLREALAELGQMPCTFRFCNGSHKGKVEGP